MTTKKQCRFCHSLLEQPFIDLGETPLANSYLTQKKLLSPEPTYPLRVLVCSECKLVQTDTFVSPRDIFSDYAYFSSYSDSWIEHARQFTVMAIKRFGLNASSQIIEVASNDGYLLRHFVQANIPVLGIEPAENIAEVARSIGVNTECRFFGAATAKDLLAQGRTADLLIGNNVLAHVPDINDFVEGLAILLKPEGVISLEFPHLLKLMQYVQFDTVYHEHFYYISLLALETVFAKYGLRIFDVEELKTHGGSLRIMATHVSSKSHLPQKSVAHIRENEISYGLDNIETYSLFQNRIEPIREGLLHFLRQAKTDGKTIVAYGAAAKGNTLLNFCKIGTDLIQYVVDRNPHKQNRFLPGSKLPIYSPEKMEETKPDYVLILPWNIKEEVIATNKIQSWGGRFVVAIPTLEILA